MGSLVGKKYGCLTVMDDGEEYTQTEQFMKCQKDFKDKISRLQPYCIEMNNLINENPELYEREKQYDFDLKFHRRLFELRERICKIRGDREAFCRLEKGAGVLYKCQCKCGKIQYYDIETLETKPKYCFYPIPISTKYTYSAAAQDATRRKEEKYAGRLCIVLCDKSECVPSEKYCGRYNHDKKMQLEKRNEQMEARIAKLPRVFAKNYDVNFTGKQYESLHIEKCCNEYFEVIPQLDYDQHHRQWLHAVTVYKQWKCKCILCGKEQIVKCDEFGIYPPDEYGVRAYDGYWSKVQCNCHGKISSFQWIVNKLLIENEVPYQVEYSFDNLLGVYGVNQLRFDFAIFDEKGLLKYLIECQGEQHYKPIDEFGGERQYAIQVENDKLKKQYAKDHGIKLIEISYKNKKIEKVETILKTNGII